MSEFFKSEQKAVPAEAQEPLSSDGHSGRTKATDQDQNTMSFCRGGEVPASSAPIGSRNGPSDGLGVSGVGVAVKHVDQRCIEGSYSGDTRAKGSPAIIPPQPGPRESVDQFPNGKFCKSAPKPASFPTSPDSDAGN
jgi:hypothetical protein